ncbi:MAG: hypothetical protein JWO89_2028 [Verrucomicrobiaceae bacterium]|nr:hypothetical protein [Verrucomicrobiaceae bacterium]
MQQGVNGSAGRGFLPWPYVPGARFGTSASGWRYTITGRKRKTVINENKCIQ